MKEQKIGEAIIELLKLLSEVEVKKEKEEENSKTYDQLMNKQQLAEKLGCHVSKVNEFYVYQNGFPRITPLGGKEMRFSHFAVDKWIAENIEYH